MAGPANVEEYLAGLPAQQRAVLDELRATVRAAAPTASESIAYQMPAFRQDGQFLVSYAAFRDHYSLFPASAAVLDELGEEVRPYLSGKGTIRFGMTERVPYDLIARIVEIRVREIGAAVAARAARRPRRRAAGGGGS
jgi:uncharacterized protein YdhG (YjbR/CyaY superfamily)